MDNLGPVSFVDTTPAGDPAAGAPLVRKELRAAGLLAAGALTCLLMVALCLLLITVLFAGDGFLLFLLLGFVIVGYLGGGSGLVRALCRSLGGATPPWSLTAAALLVGPLLATVLVFIDLPGLINPLLMIGVVLFSPVVILGILWPRRATL